MTQPQTIVETASSVADLPPGFCLEMDSDGDWVLIPPVDVTLVSVPGEGYLIGTCDRALALADAHEILSGIAAEQAA